MIADGTIATESAVVAADVVAEPGSGRFLSCHGDYELASGSP